MPVEARAPGSAHGTRCARAGARRGRRAGVISQSPWKNAPSSITRLRRDERGLHPGPGQQLDALRGPGRGPLTVPRIDTTPQSISASTSPASPTISVFSETMRPLSLPSMRKVLRKRSSPVELRALVHEAVQVLGASGP